MVQLFDMEVRLAYSYLFLHLESVSIPVED